MGSQQGAPAAKDAALRADAEVISAAIFDIAAPDGIASRVRALDRLDALVASLTAARREFSAKDMDEAVDEIRKQFLRANAAEASLAAARQREQQLTQALRFLVGCVLDHERNPQSYEKRRLDEAILRANPLAFPAVLAGEAPPTAPESGSAKNADSAPDGEEAS